MKRVHAKLSDFPNAGERTGEQGEEQRSRKGLGRRSTPFLKRKNHGTTKHLEEGEIGLQKGETMARRQQLSAPGGMRNIYTAFGEKK